MRKKQYNVCMSLSRPDLNVFSNEPTTEEPVGSFGREKISRTMENSLLGVHSNKKKKPPRVGTFSIGQETAPGLEDIELGVQGSWELVTVAILLAAFDPEMGELDTQVKLKDGGKVVDIVLPKAGLAIEIHAIFWDWLKEKSKAESPNEVPSYGELKERYTAAREKALAESSEPFTELLIAFNPQEMIHLFLNDERFKGCLNDKYKPTRLFRIFVKCAAELRNRQSAFTREELVDYIRESGLIR